MNIQQTVKKLSQTHDILSVIDLSYWPEKYDEARQHYENLFLSIRKEAYQNQERIVVIYTDDFYDDQNDLGLKLRTLQLILNAVDISNFFITVVSTNPNLSAESALLTSLSIDPVPVHIVNVSGEYTKKSIKNHSRRQETYVYGSSAPIKIQLSELDQRQKFLLTESKTFCIYPWIHLHAYPTGQAMPCCQADMKNGVVGNCKTHSLVEVWNSDEMKTLRRNMLSETPHPACSSCYEQEQAGFFSGRKSANKHHGHHINRVSTTQADGHLDQFEMVYWDIRFSNLCNLSCRSCGHIFSSSWYKDQTKLAGVEWAKQNRALNYAGRTETDIWQQLIPHLDYVEQIYFAGGEPLMMEEHYNILDELDRRGRHDVRLIYNTNFTHVNLKDRLVFDYWKRFNSVAVGASLDAMGPRAEYIRKGTDWDTVERNRVRMLETCPDVDFYISPTVSIMNAMHVPDFHRNWVDRGLLKPQDLNVNILQNPNHYRIDIAPNSYKQKIKHKFEQHLEWLRPLDSLQRATVGFESAINFMMSTDNTQLLEKFWQKTQQLDEIRNENILEVIPELAALK